jgi:ubiquinol-cytochrome c reductase cytochrome c subunit
VRRAAGIGCIVIALAATALGIVSLVAPDNGRAQGIANAPAGQGDAAQGRALFVSGCSACHGMDARGIPHRGPSLIGVGAQAADFYLVTGRMPLANPAAEPQRHPQTNYNPGEVADLVAYVASLGHGPPVPQPHPEQGDLAQGKELFSESCAGCHQIMGKGGVVTPGTVAPSLQNATDVQIAEAVRIGPYVMPPFTKRDIDDHELDSIVRYVASTRHPDNAGGWALGNIGPIPEGMVTWFIAIAALILGARLIGERTA